MRFSHSISSPGRYTFSRQLLGALVSGCICLFSCEDDMDRSSPSSQLSFTSEISSSWTSLPRSTTATDAPQGTVTTLQGGGAPLYLHTLYTDSIASPSSDNRPNTDILSRATPVTGANMYNSFGVSGYAYTDAWNESKTPDYFYNVTAGKSGSGYTLSSTYYWPGASYKMKFFAYAPKDNGRYVLSGSTHSGSPTVSVTIPGNVDEQKDLLVAKTDEWAGNTNAAVPLTFNHVLTAVRFVCGDDMQEGTVQSVSLKNVCSKGIYNMGAQSWSHIDTPATFSQTLNKSTAGTEGEVLTTDAQTFMMVPQTLPSGALLEVVFTDKSGIDHTLTADIKGTVWPVGKTVTYQISSSSINWTYTLAISLPGDFTYAGGTQPYSVTSYRENTKGVKEAIRWIARYSEDDGASWTDTRPDWLTDFTASGTGGEDAQTYHATVSAQTGTDNNTHRIALQSAPIKGSASAPYNLANQTDGGTAVQNTANCYVVNAPGYYSFPLVYGNAIKNGQTNSSAYTSTAPSGTNVLSKFINHTGNAITHPYISGNADCTPAKAELLWQDAPNLVTDIRYNPAGNGNISFMVDKNTIRQGNAVIVIKDANDTVLWSWHIWITDENINQTIEITNYRKLKYQFMPVSLGWCDAYTTSYAERSCKVKFTVGSLSKEITVRQAAHSITTGGNHPYYQWGRKDPFPPSNGVDNTNKTWYDKSGAPSTANPATENLSTGIACVKNYILKPYVMQNQFFGDHLFQNLWSANNYVDTVNDDPVIKTIYDPSPVGFKLPAGNAFTGFTTTGQYTSTPRINGTWDGSLKGWHFYTNSVKDKTTFFSALGYRYYSDGGARHIGNSGYYWLAVPNDREYGHALGFDPSRAGWMKDGDRAFGFGARSFRD